MLFAENSALISCRDIRAYVHCRPTKMTAYIAADIDVNVGPSLACVAYCPLYLRHVTLAL